MGIRNGFVEKGKTEGFGGREIGGFVNVKVNGNAVWWKD